MPAAKYAANSDGKGTYQERSGGEAEKTWRMDERCRGLEVSGGRKEQSWEQQSGGPAMSRGSAEEN